MTLPTQQVLRCQLLAFLPVGAGLTLCCSSLTTGHSPLGESFSPDSDLPLLFSTPHFPSHHESAGMGCGGVPFTSSCHSVRVLPCHSVRVRPQVRVPPCHSAQLWL